MSTWSYKIIDLPLKYDWSIARAKSSKRQNIIVSYTSDGLIGFSEVAFITGGDFQISHALKELDSFIDSAPMSFDSLEKMMKTLEMRELHSSVRSSLEVAYLDYMAKAQQVTIADLLGLECWRKFETSYSLPLLPLYECAGFIKKYDLQRFSSLKIKVKGMSSVDTVNKVCECYKGKIWIDGNESFKDFDDVQLFCQRLNLDRIEIIEQPLQRNFYEDMREVKENIVGPLWFADESVQNGVITESLKDFFDGVNIKLMKSGGLFSALRQVKEAKSLGLKVMLGCMLETSLGLSRISHLVSMADFCDLDSFLFLQKDPYEYLEEERGKITKSLQ